MELKVKSTAGTTESSDILIMLEPRTEGGISLELSSNVLQQFGKEIRAVILETLEQYGVQHAYVIAVDKGAFELHHSGPYRHCHFPVCPISGVHMGGATGCIRRTG